MAQTLAGLVQHLARACRRRLARGRDAAPAREPGRGAVSAVAAFIAGIAQRRVILFFCPIRASSANQTSIRSRSIPLSRAIASRRSGKAYGMARPSCSVSATLPDWP